MKYTDTVNNQSQTNVPNDQVRHKTQTLFDADMHISQLNPYHWKKALLGLPSIENGNEKDSAVMK